MRITFQRGPAPLDGASQSYSASGQTVPTSDYQESRHCCCSARRCCNGRIATLCNPSAFSSLCSGVVSALSTYRGRHSLRLYRTTAPNLGHQLPSYHLEPPASSPSLSPKIRCGFLVVVVEVTQVLGIGSTKRVRLPRLPIASGPRSSVAPLALSLREPGSTLSNLDAEARL